MKNPLLVCLALLGLLTTSVHAQESEPLSRTIFKLSPQHFLQNSLKAGVERFNKNYTGSIAVFVTGMMDKNESSYGQEGYNGLAGELQFRKYISPMKLQTSRHGKTFQQGVYGAAYVQGGSYSGEFKEEYNYFDPNTGMWVNQVQSDYHESIDNWGLGFAIGYQKTLWQVIYLEAFVGGGIQFSDVLTTGLRPEPNYFQDDGITRPGYKGILPKIGINIGIGL